MSTNPASNSGGLLPGRTTLQGVMTALPDFTLGFTYLITWIAPYTFGKKMVSYLVLLLIMEFIILHASAFMGVNMFTEAKPSKKALRLVGIGMLYMIFVSGFSLAFGVWWPVFAFWGLIVNRLLGILLGQAPTGQERWILMKSWAVGVVCYLLCAVLTGVVPIPSLGIDYEVIVAQEFNGSGTWIEEPYTALAFGFIYFTVVALFELRAYSSIKVPQSFDRISRIFRTSPGSSSEK